jgi:hypothetical protein
MDAHRKRIPLSRGRKLACDVIQFGVKAPLGAVRATFDLSRIAEIRKRIRPKLSWNVIFMKAYSQLSSDWPQLQQCIVKFPWHHIYQHDRNVCVIAVAREYRGEETLLFARFERPENFSLVQLQHRLNFFRDAPINEVRQFRHQLRFAAWPRVLRQVGWWMLTNLWVSKRASYFGTFGMSLSGFDNIAFASYHLGPSTTMLGVDVVARRGQSNVLLTFDHRVLDGKPVLDIVKALERQLNGPILQEMTALAASSSDNAGDPGNDGRLVA